MTYRYVETHLHTYHFEINGNKILHALFTYFELPKECLEGLLMYSSPLYLLVQFSSIPTDSVCLFTVGQTADRATGTAIVGVIITH